MTDTTRRFFERTLPTWAASNIRRLFATDGAIAFRVGQAGWTFRFSAAEPIEKSFDRYAPLCLHFSDESFTAFLDGSLDVARAVASGALKARGDLRLLETFGRFLQPEGAGLGWSASSNSQTP